MDLRAEFANAGFPLAEGIDRLFPHQEEAVEWASNRPEPYLFINAPTGSGKTLINATTAVRANIGRAAWTYAVSTILLQRQVSATFQQLPVFTGRGNYECLIGLETYPGLGSVTAADGICTLPTYARGDCGHDSSAPVDARCPYYQQQFRAMSSRGRVTNYALLLSYPPLVEDSPRRPSWQLPTRLLLCDEAHNVEQAVTNAVSLGLSRRTAQRLSLKLPSLHSIAQWVEWARTLELRVPKDPDRGFGMFYRTVEQLREIDPNAGDWIVEEAEWSVSFHPIWGAPFVTQRLMGTGGAPTAGLLSELGGSRGISKALFTSATLMGADYVAELLGLPDGSWAYLDMPSVFSAAHRPINYAPVRKMNAASVGEPTARAQMQAAVDKVIEHYVLGGKPWGIIHAVSNKYRDLLLTESSWRGIMTADVAVHADKVAKKLPSVLVAANISEGWDGVDDLCRFVIMPKVPFPNLGDRRTKLRMEEDSRSFDYQALVAVVQGAGRGVRHAQDFADTWILDELWAMLYAKRKDWLPASFKESYHHKVQLPGG